MKKRTRRTKGIVTWRQMTGALMGCGLALIGILFLSLMLYWNGVGEGAIRPVIGILKVVCPFAAGFFALQKPSERTAVTGAVAGALFEIILVLLLCFCTNTYTLNWTLLGDLVISVATGIAGAMVKGLLLDKQKK